MAEHLAKHRDEIPQEVVDEFDDLIGNLKRNVDKIHEHGRRADSIVYGMLQHSRSGEAERATTDINALVDEHLKLAYHGKRAQDPDLNAELVTDYDPAVGSVEVVPQDLGRVLLNLVGNALDAASGIGADVASNDPIIWISTARANGNVEISVRDNGPGIPEDVRKKIFEPFFTTKPTGSGTGLGLSMSYDIVTKGHGGDLSVVSEEGQGATFVITLPA